MPASKKPRSSGVYKIVHRESGRLYIGSSRDVAARWKGHKVELRAGKHGNAKLQRAWAKYGEAGFEFHLVEEVADEGLLMQREQHWIDATGCVSTGFNILPLAGRALGAKRTQEQRLRLSNAVKGKPKSVAHRAAIGAAQVGRVITAAEREKHRANRLGKVMTEETRRKISEARKGMKFTPEHIANVVEGKRKSRAQKQIAA